MGLVNEVHDRTIISFNIIFGLVEILTRANVLFRLIVQGRNVLIIIIMKFSSLRKITNWMYSPFVEELFCVF